jgi:integrase
LSLLSSIFRYARDELGMELDNPVARVRKPKPSKARVRRLSADEEARLMLSLAQCKHPQVERVSRFLLETAMRRSEALGLVWQQVDLVRRLVTLSDSKNGHPRWIPLTSRACELLQCAGAPNEAVFPISESALSQAWGHAVRRAGIEDLRLHDLRHEALSRWAHRLNGDVFKLAMISGHRTLQMAQRYVHPVQSELLASAMYE